MGLRSGLARLTLSLLLPWLCAFGGNDRFELVLQGGASVTGWYVSVDQGILKLSGDNRITPVPVDLVVAVRLNDQDILVEDFLDEVRQSQERLDLMRADPGPSASPALAGGLSLAWAGAGHLAVGAPKEAVGWAVLDGALIGAAAWTLAAERSVGATVPILALDVLVRVAAASDASRAARRKRRALSGGSEDR